MKDFPKFQLFLSLLVGVIFGFTISTIISSRSAEPKNRSTPEDTVATVGNRYITQDDLLVELQRQSGISSSGVNKSSALQTLIQRAHLLEAAHIEGIANARETVRAIENLLIGRFRQDFIENKLEELSVSDAELKTYYEANLAEFEVAQLDRIAVLYRMIPEQAESSEVQAVVQELELAREKAAQLDEDTKGFGLLSVEYSEDMASRFKGGDKGWFEAGQTGSLPAEVLSKAKSLDVGTISEVIRANAGLYLIKVTDRRSSDIQSFERVSGALRMRLLQEKRNAEKQRIVSELKNRHQVVVDKKAVEAVAWEPKPDSSRPPSI